MGKVANARPIPIDFDHDRFWFKVEPTGFCWYWTAYKMEFGHGTFRIGATKYLAHRVAYALLVGEVDSGLVLDHVCRNPSCVNPDHVEPVAQGENSVRGFGPAGMNSRKTHCPEGHELAGENLVKSSSARKCRTCHNLWVRDHLRKVRAERRLAA